MQSEGDSALFERVWDPEAFHVLAKPAGAICNLGCSYCFFLDKEDLYRGSRFHMSDEVFDQYIRQLIEAHSSPVVTVAWQGGEPTLMGLDFYRRAIEIQEKYCKPGMTFENAMQTNGTLVTDEWVRDAGRNDPCPYGSGDKTQRCHGGGQREVLNGAEMPIGPGSQRVRVRNRSRSKERHHGGPSQHPDLMG